MSTTVERRVRVDDGIELRVREHRPSETGDDGRDLLLVHGLSSNALLWDGVAAMLASAGHRSVAVDLRSHGRSDGSDDLAHERVVADLVAVIERTGLDRPVAVGQSWGENVVVELAATRSASVGGVVAVDGGLITLADLFPDVESWLATLARIAQAGMHEHRDLVAPHVETLLALRRTAREERRFADADLIRDALVAAGVEVHDGDGETRWEFTDPLAGVRSTVDGGHGAGG